MRISVRYGPAFREFIISTSGQDLNMRMALPKRRDVQIQCNYSSKYILQDFGQWRGGGGGRKWGITDSWDAGKEISHRL